MVVSQAQAPSVWGSEDPTCHDIPPSFLAAEGQRELPTPNVCRLPAELVVVPKN